MSEDAKAALRREMRARRKALQASHPFAADRLVAWFQAAGLPPPIIAALYRRQGAEIGAEPLALHLAEAGARVAVPVMLQAGQPLMFQAVDDFPCANDPLTPTPHAAMVEPDLIIVPLLAFDGTGARLGQGGGYYDRTLSARRRLKPPPLAIGLAYAGQQIDRVPTDAYDQPLDGVLTEDGFIDFRGAR